jgi:glycerol-3-phosphate acyltransferase PlsX
MGLAYSRVVLDVVEPRIALLNIGEEPTKGSQLALDSYALLSDGLDEFVGNVEAHHLLDGELDVVVTDGFTGNVALKLLEGTSKSLLDQVREALTSTALASLAAAAARPALRLLRDRLDPDAYGGAPLLGVEGICIIGHGSSNATAVANGIRVGAYASRGDLTGRIRSSFSHDV